MDIARYKDQKNQIDHITIARRWRKSLQDVRVYRGADVGSDHELLVANFKIKISKVIKKDGQMNRRYNIEKLRDEQNTRDFTIKLSNRFQALADIEDGTLEMKWKREKDSFTSICENELGYNKRQYKIWLSNGTIDAIEKRRSTKIKLDQAKTRSQKDKLSKEHSSLHKEIKRKAKLDKRTYINQLATQAENAMIRNDTKTVYNITRQLSGRKTNTTRPIKDTNGTTITQLEKQLERWKDYFSSLLNGVEIANTPDIPPGDDLDIETSAISKEEIIKAIRKSSRTRLHTSRST